MSMSPRLLAVSAVFAFAGAAFAASPQTGTSAPASKPHTAQQQRMINCNKQAAGKKGAERKALMGSCLKGHAAAVPSARQAQHEKMKTCNADAKAKTLKGAERKTFMSTCLKSGTAEAVAAP